MTADEPPRLDMTVRLQSLNTRGVYAGKVVAVHPDGSYDVEFLVGQQSFEPITVLPDGNSAGRNFRRLP